MHKLNTLPLYRVLISLTDYMIMHHQLHLKTKSVLIFYRIRPLITSLPNPKLFSHSHTHTLTYHLINILSKDFINYIVTDLNKLLLLCYSESLHESLRQAENEDWGDFCETKKAACSQEGKQYFVCMFYC